MSAASDYLEDAFLDHALSTSAFTMPTGVFLALFTTNPTDAFSGTEHSGDGYARIELTFAAASGGSASNSTQEDFNAATADWPEIGWWGIFDAATVGNGLFHGAWDTAFTVLDGQQFRVRVGDIVISAD